MTATSSQTLLVGCMSRAAAYQAESQQLKDADHPFRGEMVDRLLQGAVTLEPAAFGTAILLLTRSDWLDGRLWSLVLGALAAYGSLLIRDVAIEEVDELSTLLHQAGFADSHYVAPTLSARAPSASDGTNGRTSVPLRIRRKDAAATSAKKASLWALTREPLNGLSTPSIDESSLLTQDDLKRREAIQRPDCDVKRTRKACKNCSCGLRELLLQEQDDLSSTAATIQGQSAAQPGVQTVTTGALTSSCGSCYLGDAFRCASCPYLGLPAFKPGEKVQIASLADDL